MFMALGCMFVIVLFLTFREDNLQEVTEWVSGTGALDFVRISEVVSLSAFLTF